MRNGISVGNGRNLLPCNYIVGIMETVCNYRFVSLSCVATRVYDLPCLDMTPKKKKKTEETTNTTDEVGEQKGKSKVRTILMHI